MTEAKEFVNGQTTEILSHTAPSHRSRGQSQGLGDAYDAQQPPLQTPGSFVVTTLTATTKVTNLPSSIPYRFPTHRLPTQMKDESKIPLILVACGSFSPVTYLHLRMFEMANDYYKDHPSEYELVAGYFSPVNDCYRKQGLAAGHHRVTMCQLATETTSNWIMVDPWESIQNSYQRTIVVLDHFHQELNVHLGGMTLSDGSVKQYKIMLLAGGDLINSFGEPNVWADVDLDRILGIYGCTIIERTGTDVYGFLLAHDKLYEHRSKVHVVKQLIYNDISSTKVRLFVKRNMSIKYLLPDPVIKYIEEQALYKT